MKTKLLLLAAAIAMILLTGCRALGYDHQTWPGGSSPIDKHPSARAV